MAIRRALKKMEANHPEIIKSSSLSVNDSFVPYRDVDHFLEVNPNCCSIEREYKNRKDYGKRIIDVYGKALYQDESGRLYSSKEPLLLQRQYIPRGIYYLP